MRQDKISGLLEMAEDFIRSSVRFKVMPDNSENLSK